MHQRLATIFLGAVFTLALGGCESHQGKVDALQKEYDQLGAQMQKDCSAEYLKVPPTLSQKCVDENKKVTGGLDPPSGRTD